jgi:hypothetical protein
MLEPNISVLFVILDIFCNCNWVISNKILLVVLCLIHAYHKLDISVFVKGRDIKVKRTSGHHHYITTIDLSESSLDGEFGLVELLLS